MFKRSASAILLLAAALILAPATGASAQTTGRIFGQVLDAQGAALPGATVLSVQTPDDLEPALAALGTSGDRA